MAGVRDISERANIDPNIARAFVDEIVKAVLEGEQVQLRGLGTLKLDKLSSRAYGNTQIGTLTYKPERSTVKFKIAKSLKGILIDLDEQEGLQSGGA